MTDVQQITPSFARVAQCSPTVSDAAILRGYQCKDEFFRPEVVAGHIATIEARLGSSRVVVAEPRVNGFEMRAIRDVLRNRGYRVEAPERGFYRVIDRLTVTKLQ